MLEVQFRNPIQGPGEFNDFKYRSAVGEAEAASTSWKIYEKERKTRFNEKLQNMEGLNAAL